MDHNNSFFYGDSTRWFLGEVVNIDDPDYLARVQVMIYGVHDRIDHEDLPWALVSTPTNEGGTMGYGNPLGIQVGARVIGLFLDGPDSQLPIVLGSIPKVEFQYIEEKIEKDPRLNPTIKESLNNHYRKDKGNPTYRSTNHLTHGFTGGFLGQAHPYYVENEIGVPDDPYDPKYPNNKVYQTEGNNLNEHFGHIKEYDDTAGKERIYERHSAGTFYQINPNGDLVLHVIGAEDGGNRYTVIANDDSLHVKGNVKIVVDNNADISVKGAATMSVGKNATVTVGGETTVLSKKDINVHSNTKVQVTAPETDIKGGVVKLNS